MRERERERERDGGAMKNKKQILIVEDNELNREILSEILAGEYQLLTAENGQEGLEVLRAHKNSVALILLDVMMPVMDGYTFLDKLEEDAELALIPVIVMTQNESEADEVNALDHGATDFVPKPYRPQVILHRVASIIKLRETAAMVNQLQYDRLTVLYTKEFFYQKVRERLEEDPEGAYSIVCSNIEHFKLVNDAFGAQEGDRLLIEVARLAQTMVGEKGFCGRFTADHFLCFQEREKERQDRVNFGAFSSMKVSPLLQSVAMRWGVYEITDRSIPVEQMCDRALLAANSIKGKYNQFFAMYDEELRDKLLREKNITDAMEPALAQKQFVVYFQPLYSLKDGGLTGAEALVRWNHPEWGFLSPGAFIPLFEKNGFISRLDRYVWERVCAQLRAWQQEGKPLLPVAVNMSRADIYQADLVKTLQAMTEKYGVDPSLLHLEITESAYAEKPEQIISTVDQLRRLGFVVEMDDFGSGYSSLNMLNQMKLDILKLDMKFIQNETAKPAEQGILRFIVSLARWLNLSVVAEGVETREQLERLREIGCDYVQGYFFAKPMPDAEFEALLSAQSARRATGATSPKRASNSGMQKLLVVDEDAAYRASVAESFEGLYQVQQASSAKEALDYIHTCGDAPVAIVVLSATLPDDGANVFLNAMRQNPTLWRIPVLATILPGADIEKLALSLDIDDFLCKRHPILDLRRRVRRLLSEVRHREREQILLDEAYRDYLTGLLNRRGLYAAIDALRQEDLPLALYMFDLDDLKKTNDSFGHDSGDEMLQYFAELLRQQTREGDILCRYGGDEFVVILRRIGSRETIMRKGGEICRGFSRFQSKDGVPVTCSVGVVLCGEDEKPSGKLIEWADRALYQAKHAQKGSCVLWEDRSNGAPPVGMENTF